MALEINNVYEYLSFDPKDIDTPEKFKAKFDEIYIRQSDAASDPAFIDKAFGKNILKTVTAAKKIAEGMGIELDKEQLKDKKFDEQISYILTTSVKAKEDKIKELETKIGSANPEAEKLWADKYSKLEAKYNDTSKLHTATVTAFDEYRAAKDQEKKTWEITSANKDLWSKAKFSSAAKALEIEGFQSRFEKNFKWQLDENGNTFLGNDKGERIKSEAKQGQFKEPFEILESEANKPGVWAVSDPKGVQPLFKPAAPVNGVQNNNVVGRSIHPKAVQAAI